MKIGFAYHVFAHKDGRYQTASSFGVDPHEIKSLEQFFFGQSNDSVYLQSLRTEPGVIWRRIGGKVALTRVTQGTADSNGRSTLKFETLLDADSETPLTRTVAEVVLGNWKISSAGASITPYAAAVTLPINPEGISRVALAVREGKRIIHPAKSFSLRDVAAIVESCADEPDFSLCFKSTNDRAPLVVNLVSQNVSEKTMSTSSRAKPSPLPRASRSVHELPPSRSNTLILLAVCMALIVQTIFVWRVTRVSNAPETSSEMQNQIINHVENGFNLQAKHDNRLEQLLTKEIAERKKSDLEHRNALDTAKRERAALKNELAGGIHGLKEQVYKMDTSINKDQTSIRELQKSMQKSLTTIKNEIKDGFSGLIKLINKYDAQSKPSSDSEGKQP